MGISKASYMRHIERQRKRSPEVYFRSSGVGVDVLVVDENAERTTGHGVTVNRSGGATGWERSVGSLITVPKPWWKFWGAK